MGRPKKEFDMFHCRLEKKLSRALDEYCKKTRFTKTAVIERALERYLEDSKRTERI